MTYLFTLYFCDDIFTEVKISLLYSSLGDEDEKSRAAECLRSSVEICIQRIKNKTFLKVCLVFAFERNRFSQSFSVAANSDMDEILLLLAFC